ncbi:hypothetical protein [Croceicoccus sp. BE223]|uniref:hypothetical protein n=1 Tax=Croceicoccus sp. BE223 TaxID=2817716 RepID=UPI00285F9DC8|nr:hypothetical protein [Croceicoccus sp. BE223]MDR7103246.1 hypothetical protein [Croceicoccus sp. BE223]
MEFEISDHETLPSHEARVVPRQIDRAAMPRQMADDATPDPTIGLREPVRQLTQQG